MWAKLGVAMSLSGLFVGSVTAAWEVVPGPWWAPALAAMGLTMLFVGFTGLAAWTERGWRESSELLRAQWTIRQYRQLVRVQSRRKEKRR